MTSVDTVFVGPVLTRDGITERSVLVRDGRIVDVGPADPGTEWGEATVIEVGADEVLIPGLVDTHVHVNEPGRTEWEGFASATRAAAAGGVTTIMDMPLNSIPATTSVEALDTKRRAADGQCVVDVGFWGGAVPESLGHLAELHEAGVFGFKCFLLDSGVPEFPPLDDDQLRAAMTEIAGFDGLLIVHAEDAAVIADHQSGPSTTYADFLNSRPPEAETTAIARVIEHARTTGCRVHIVHLSSAAALPMITAAKADGVRLTVETCPHYLTLTAEQVPDGHTEFKCCPPVRSAANSDQLWQALADGVIDIVVSDHSPCTADLKLLDVGDFAGAWGGIASLQLGLSLIWTEARRRGHDLAQVISWMAERTGDVTRLVGKGRIEPGAAADVVVFAPDASWTIDAATLYHRNAVTPYHGRTVTGSVRATYLRGQLVDLDDKSSGAQLLRRK